MIELTKLLDANFNFPHSLRYSKNSKNQTKGTKQGMGPVIAWNITRNCNLECKHCYSSAYNKNFSGELATSEIKNVIDDLARINVPVILISGGEPLLREDLFDIINYARSKNIKITLSTNGTLLDKNTARKIKNAGVSYIGISLDGLKKTHNTFRGKKNAFSRAIKGINNCLEINQKVGIRFTITKSNFKELPAILNLIEKKDIPRACFYHLVYSGRGENFKKADTTSEQKKQVIDLLYKKSLNYIKKEIDKEILTVANQTDGVYTYLKLKEDNPRQAKKALTLLKHNGGNRSGIAIASIDWKGEVHPNQFMTDYSPGNVRNKKFSKIWQPDNKNNLLSKLRNRKKYLQGKCSQCKWLEICNGNSRMRAKVVNDNFWAEDPACYLKKKTCK